MITKEILSKYTVPQLQAIIKKTNVKGFTKLSKPQIIIEMNKPEHKSNFSLVGELSSFTLPNLKAELKRTNVAKFNTLTKSDLIDKMLLPDHISNFDELKPREAPKKRGIGKKTIEADKILAAANKEYDAIHKFTPKLDGEIIRWYRKMNAIYVVEIMDDEFVADDDAFKETAQELYGHIEREITLTKTQLKIVNNKIRRQIDEVVEGIMDDDFDANEDNFVEIIDSILKWD